MKTYKYDNLLELTYSEIEKITAKAESFKIVAEGKVGQRISLFLENEKNFAASDKSFINRLRYMFGGRHGMLTPNFMPLWNRALMDGFTVEKIEQSKGIYEFIFVPSLAESK